MITWNRELSEKEMHDASAYLKQILDGQGLGLGLMVRVKVRMRVKVKVPIKV